MATRAATGAGRPFTTDLTVEQRRNYTRLTTAIAEAMDSGKSVPCLRLPKFFDLNLTKPPKQAATATERKDDAELRKQLRTLRDSMCRRCPVLEECLDYAGTGAPVYGFIAGSWSKGR